MIPCLYDISETDFKTNGIGKLADCISCVVIEKRNGSYELKLEYPSDGIHADELTEGNIILAKPADNKSPQPFRIYKITAPLDGTLEIAARHISYQLNFITVSPVTVISSTDKQPKYAFEGLVENASTNVPFSFETDITSTAYFGILEPTSFRSALGGVDGSMLDTFGGEFEWDYYTVRLLKSRGSDNGVRIVYGKNLVDFTMEKSIEDTITGVHPYYKNTETGDILELADKIVTLSDIGVSSDFPFDKIALLDCSDEFDEQPTEYQLLKCAESYLKTTTAVEPDIDITINFAQLWQTADYEDIAEAERVSLCDTVHVYVSKLGIEVDAAVTETEYDTLLERYKSITLSNAVSSSRNSSLSLTLATTSQVKSLLAITDNSIRLSVTNTLSNYTTTEQVRSLIEVSETYATTHELGNYTKTDEVRSRFAMDSTSISISSGVITFESNTISIDSDNFKLTESGEVTATGAFSSIDGESKLELNSGQIIGYYSDNEVGSISINPNHNWSINGTAYTYNGIKATPHK